MRHFKIALLLGLWASFALTGCDTYQLSMTNGPSTSCNAIWDSEKTNNLSPVKSCQCNTLQNELITGLEVWKERTSNADNFIARLGTECRAYRTCYDNAQYLNVDASTPAQFCEVFTSNHRPEGNWIRIPDGTVAIGAQLRVNNPDGYVKDIRLKYARIKVIAGQLQMDPPEYTDWANNYTTGQTHLAECTASPMRALSGILLQHHVSRGKIRKMTFNFAQLNLNVAADGVCSIEASPAPSMQLCWNEDISDFEVLEL